MKYKCIIVEDNILERDALAVQVKKIDSLILKATLADGLEALERLKQDDIDIVFSDIDMPDLTGIQLLKSLKHPPVFIFISSHSEHAAESFNLDVIDYIVKPVRIDRLIKATNKAIEYIEAKNNTSASEPSKTNPAPKSVANELVKTIDAEEYFFIREKNAYIKINMGDVLYIESMGDFSRIVTTQQKTHLALISLKNLEKQLPEKWFLRVHKQFIVNILHIQHINSSDIRLASNDIIPVSVAYKQLLLDNVVNKKSLTRYSAE